MSREDILPVGGKVEAAQKKDTNYRHTVLLLLVLVLLEMVLLLILRTAPQQNKKAVSTAVYNSSLASTFNKQFAISITPASSPSAAPLLPAASAPAAIPVTDPIASFEAAMAKDDYRITVTGNLEGNDIRNFFGNSGVRDSSGSDKLVIYDKHGSVMRVDIGEEKNTDFGYSIYRPADRKFYNVLLANRSEVVVNTALDFGQLPLVVFDSNYTPISLAVDNLNGQVAWETADRADWTGTWKVYSPSLSNFLTVYVRVNTDPQSGLITQFSIRHNKGEPWQIATYKYEKVTDIDSYLQINSSSQSSK